MLQLREKRIFETLKRIRKYDFVVIGGYAVNAYALPRFSADCDVVLRKRNKLMEKSLVKENYKLVETSYKKGFFRYERKIGKNFKVSMDVLVGKVFDRQTNAVFSADWVFNNSSLISLKGKTINEELKLRIIDVDALIVIKIVSCRNVDIRDVFMLMPKAKDKEWIRKEISARYDFDDRFSKVRDKITSLKFKDDLQGVYGFIDEFVFERHKKAFFFGLGL